MKRLAKGDQYMQESTGSENSEHFLHSNLGVGNVLQHCVTFNSSDGLRFEGQSLNVCDNVYS